MARLTSEQWEQARAEYEVRGVSLGEVARRFGVSQQAASKRARKEGRLQDVRAPHRRSWREKLWAGHNFPAQLRIVP